MKYDPKSDTMTLSSGRKLYVFSGKLSLSPFAQEDDQMLCYGHDGEVEEDAMPLRANGLTADERREIASAMIEAWAKWGGATCGEPVGDGCDEGVLVAWPAGATVGDRNQNDE